MWAKSLRLVISWRQVSDHHWGNLLCRCGILFLTVVSTLSFAQYLLHIPEKFLTENTITHNLHTQQEKDQNPETKTTSTPNIRKKKKEKTIIISLPMAIWCHINSLILFTSRFCFSASLWFHCTSCCLVQVTWVLGRYPVWYVRVCVQC